MALILAVVFVFFLPVFSHSKRLEEHLAARPWERNGPRNLLARPFLHLTGMMTELADRLRVASAAEQVVVHV